MKTLGDLMFQVEDLVEQFVDVHDMQRGEIMALIDNYIVTHYPGAIEEYEDGSSPIYFYGPVESMKLLYKDRLEEHNNDN